MNHCACFSKRHHVSVVLSKYKFSLFLFFLLINWPFIVDIKDIDKDAKNASTQMKSVTVALEEMQATLLRFTNDLTSVTIPRHPSPPSVDNFDISEIHLSGDDCYSPEVSMYLYMIVIMRLGIKSIYPNNLKTTSRLPTMNTFVITK